MELQELKSSDGFICFTLTSGLIVSCLSTLVLLITLELLKLLVRVQLSDTLMTEEVLEADNESDAISLEFKQADGTHITYVVDLKQVRGLLLIMLLFLKRKLCA